MACELPLSSKIQTNNCHADPLALASIMSQLRAEPATTTACYVSGGHGLQTLQVCPYTHWTKRHEISNLR